MKTITVSFLLYYVALSMSALGEGIASSTIIDTSNIHAIGYHDLDIKFGPQKPGKLTSVTLSFKVNDRDTVPGECQVKIFDKVGEGASLHAMFEVSVQAHQELQYSVRFSVAPHLLDGVELRYHLPANDFQSHVFVIKAGEFPNLEKSLRSKRSEDD